MCPPEVRMRQSLAALFMISSWKALGCPSAAGYLTPPGAFAQLNTVRQCRQTIPGHTQQHGESSPYGSQRKSGTKDSMYESIFSDRRNESLAITS